MRLKIAFKINFDGFLIMCFLGVDKVCGVVVDLWHIISRTLQIGPTPKANFP
jgi:hypothetical protein